MFLLKNDAKIAKKFRGAAPPRPPLGRLAALAVALNNKKKTLSGDYNRYVRILRNVRVLS